MPPGMTRENEHGQPVGDEVPGWKPASRPPKSSMNGRFVRIEPLNAVRHGVALFDSFAEEPTGRDWTYMPIGPFADRDTFDGWLETAQRCPDPMFHAILDAKTGAARGFASYLRIAPQPGTIEVGFIAFSPRLQGSPGATEAMYLMMARAFDELGYRRYEWKCDALNARSRAAAERLGFTFEGIFRQATIVKGRNRDTAWYSILDSEWPVRKAAFRAWLEASNFDEGGRQIRRLADIRAELE